MQGREAAVKTRMAGWMSKERVTHPPGRSCLQRGFAAPGSSPCSLCLCGKCLSELCGRRQLGVQRQLELKVNELRSFERAEEHEQIRERDVDGIAR